MTYAEKLKQDTGLDVNGSGCPCDHGYEERQGFTVHCTAMTCEECWNREMKEKENGNMKYKVGDTVLVQGIVTEVDEGGEYSSCKLSIKARFDSFGKAFIWLADDELFELPKQDKTYEQGLQDAWEFMKKCFYSYTAKECEEIFGKVIVEHIVMAYTPQEALAKLKEYEDSQKIKVGDVVEFKDGTKGIVMDADTDDSLALFTENGCVEAWINKEHVKKTGKHIDIAGLFEQIKGE